MNRQRRQERQVMTRSFQSSARTRFAASLGSDGMMGRRRRIALSSLWRSSGDLCGGAACGVVGRQREES